MNVTPIQVMSLLLAVGAALTAAYIEWNVRNERRLNVVLIVKDKDGAVKHVVVPSGIKVVEVDADDKKAWEKAILEAMDEEH